MSEITHGIAWREEYKLGNEQVDEQHYQLFALVSKLVTSCMDGSDMEKLKETLDFLVNYTVCHFNDEEALQVRYNYPDYERHRQLHEDFKVTAQGLAQSFAESGSSEELSNAVNKTVINWLTNHILIEDKKIGDHIQRIAK